MPDRRSFVKLLIAVVLLFATGLMCQPMLVTLLFVLLPQKAIELARAVGQQDLAEQLNGELKHHEAGPPFHQ